MVGHRPLGKAKLVGENADTELIRAREQIDDRDSSRVGKRLEAGGELVPGRLGEGWRARRAAADFCDDLP